MQTYRQITQISETLRIQICDEVSVQIYFLCVTMKNGRMVSKYTNNCQFTPKSLQKRYFSEAYSRRQRENSNFNEPRNET